MSRFPQVHCHITPTIFYFNQYKHQSSCFLQSFYDFLLLSKVIYIQVTLKKEIGFTNFDLKQKSKFYIGLVYEVITHLAETHQLNSLTNSVFSSVSLYQELTDVPQNYGV